MRSSMKRCLMGGAVSSALLFACLAAGCASDDQGRLGARENDVESLSGLVADPSAPAPVKESSVSPQPSKDTEGLRESITQAMQSYAGSYAVACAAVDGSWSVAIDGEAPYVSASVIKLAILGTLLEQVQGGVLSLDDSVVVESSDIVGGTGVIQSLGSGGSYSYRQLATYMIQDSDNVATNKIIDKVGQSAVNEFASEIGLTQTRLNRRMMDFSTGTENYVSADDVAKILQLIGNGQYVSADMSAFALELLRGQHDTSGLLEGLPEGVGFAHKTGELDEVFNDAGIVLADEPYVLVVLANDVSQADAQSFMTEVAQSAAEFA